MNPDRSELTEGLALLAGHAPDASTTSRLLEHVPSMVARVRHRRARRRAGTGLAAVGVAAATVGAFTLLGPPPTPVAPATQTQTSTSAVPTCGAPFAAVDAAAGDVGVTVALDGTADRLTVSVSVRNLGAGEVMVDGPSGLTVLVVGDGIVVGRLSAPTAVIGGLEPNVVNEYGGIRGVLRTCIPGTPDDRLPDGTYTVVGLVQTTVQGAPAVLGGTGVPLVVSQGSMSTAALDEAGAQGLALDEAQAQDSARASAEAQDLAARVAMLATIRIP